MMNIFYTPEAFLTLWAIFLLLISSIWMQINPRVISLLGVLGAIITLFIVRTSYPVLMANPPYAMDGLAFFFKDFFLITLIFVLLMGATYSVKLESARCEFFILPLFTTVGLLLLSSARDFVLLFVALELVTISLYILVSYHRTQGSGLEAGTKYLIVGGLATGFLVYGLAFVYGVGEGQLDFRSLYAHFLMSKPFSAPLIFAMLLILAAVGFKIAAVPFHAWAPDVYQGAPAPVTAFLATASKAAGFVILLRLFYSSAPDVDFRHLHGVFAVPQLSPIASQVIGWLAGASMLLGSLAALTQRNIKRLMGYSSIANAGFILMGFVTLDTRGATSVLLYLSMYLMAVLLVFLVVCQVSVQAGGEDWRHFAGLSKRSPFLAFGMALALTSLAGIPPLAGFVGKFSVFASALSGGHFVLITIGVISAVATLYYYLSFIRAMYWEETNETAFVPCSSTMASVFVLSLGIIVFGIWQQPILARIHQALIPGL